MLCCIVMIKRKKTYLLHSLPHDFSSYTIEEIIDVYVPMRNGTSQLCICKRDKIYECIKTNILQKWNNFLQTEHTIGIDEDEFDYLFTYLPYILQKKTYSFSPQKWVFYSINIFEWNLLWLLTIDVCFANESLMKKFIVPSFFSREITQNKKFFWSFLAQMKKCDVEQMFNILY